MNSGKGYLSREHTESGKTPERLLLLTLATTPILLTSPNPNQTQTHPPQWSAKNAKRQAFPRPLHQKDLADKSQLKNRSSLKSLLQTHSHPPQAQSKKAQEKSAAETPYYPAQGLQKRRSDHHLQGEDPRLDSRYVIPQISPIVSSMLISFCLFSSSRREQ